MSDRWTDDQNAVTAAAKELPEGFTTLWDRDRAGFRATLYFGRGLALASSTDRREAAMEFLAETAREFASNDCIDLEGWPAREQFTVSAQGRAITCWSCGRTSYISEDVMHRYCGGCQRFHDEVTRP